MNLLEQIKQELEQRDSAMRARLEALERGGETLEDVVDRLEQLESRSNQPGRTGGGDDRRAREHLQKFEKFLRNPSDAAVRAALSEFQARDVTIASPSSGGYAVPEQIDREIERLERLFSPLRNLVRVVKVGTSDYKQLVSIGGASAGWVGESDNRTKTDTSLLRERAPTHGELYAYPQASEWSLNDVFFNVAEWLADEAAQAFAVAEGAAIISGDGTSKPTGMLTSAPVATADHASPLRDAAKYEAIASLTSSSPAVAEILPDILIDTVYKLNSAYRSGASWIMNSTTAATVRKFKNQQGDYLWRDGLADGQPAQLLGYPVNLVEGMPDIDVNAYPIGFGNWRRAYLLCDIGGLRLTRDEITSPGFHKFYIRRRVGGCVLNNDAAKFVKTTVA